VNETRTPVNLLEPFGQFYASALEAVLTDLYKVPVSCLLVSQSQNGRDQFLPLLGEWSLALEAEYQTVPPGRLGFFFKPKEARHLCHLDQGAPSGNETPPGPAESDRLKAILTQTIGRVAPQLRESLDVACTPSEATDAADAARADGPYFAGGAPTLITLMIEAEASSFDAQVLLLVSPALAGALRGDPPRAAAPERPEPAVRAAASAGSAPGPPPVPKDPVAPLTEMERNLERILDIELPVVLNFGQTQMLLKDVLQFSAGSIIQLDRTVDEPVYLMVNNKVIALGDVVIVDGNYGIRITEIESTAARIRSLR